jgi:CelD/BcsL family acetyltransferase involved in cellulose biosynthesis
MNAPGAEAPSPLRVEIVRNIRDAEQVWRACEHTCVLTPYQRFDWIHDFVTAGGECGGEAMVAILHDEDGVAALLPLIVEERRLGIRRARIMASCISNSDWMIVRPDAAPKLTRRVLVRALADISRTGIGFDILALSHQPRSWGGIPNPLLAFTHGPSPSNLYFAAMPTAPGSVLDSGVSRKQRKNLRRGMAGLAEMHGSVRLERVSTEAELDRVHQTFLAQRGARFAAMGVDNIFADAAFIAFFRGLALKGLDDERPALAFHALYAGERIVATCCGAFAGDHYSKYMNSITVGPEARYSLTGILMAYLVDALRARGITSMDMGIGDFDYKADWTAEQPVFDSVIPVSPAGWLAAPGLVLARRAKRAIKQNERLWALAQSVRLHTYRARQWRRGTA